MLIATTLTTQLILLLLVSSQQQGTVDAWWFTATDPAPIKAIANFDMDGVQGTFKFSQASAGTLVEYDLHGLKSNNKLYHVHVRPVPPFDAAKIKANLTNISELCGDASTGGHLNPHHITAKLPPKSASADKYELGDLAGKHGPLTPKAGEPDHYVGSFTDDHLPISGEHSIINRSIVIHKNDGKRWVCATISAH